ncbi:hypothetical protein HU200_028726 [Digitaria exilis]|uniref:non-specific serine/threonine protein kinase n=1 Tax=Digitaria exilis TaxID=1010633 RepID=A0A835BVY3_9POAL|nr:hypothetical protein HU200_028726 [Digitaria exilis]
MSTGSSSSLAFAAGLYDTGPNQDDRILFGVYTVCVINITTFGSVEVEYYIDYSYSATTVLWSANRDHLLQNATLNFTADGDLLLQDIHGNPVWSTNTSGQSAAGITLTDSGNQCSSTTITTHTQKGDAGNSTQKGKPYASITNGNQGLWTTLNLPPAESFQFLRFESDGHLRLYDWKDDQQFWSLEDDVFKLDACDYPSVCGDYGVCSNGQCICPVASDTGATYFKQTDSQRPNLGCTLLNPISCQSLSQHQLIGIANVSSFVMPVMDDTFLLREYGEPILVDDEESCKLTCLRNCSCRAALFVGNFSRCFLLQHVFSLQANTGFETGAYLKVQLSELTHTQPSGKHKVLLGSIIAG